MTKRVQLLNYCPRGHFSCLDCFRALRSGGNSLRGLGINTVSVGTSSKLGGIQRKEKNREIKEERRFAQPRHKEFLRIACISVNIW